MAPSPYLVACLVQLRAEFNAINPRRDKSSDGWIGDVAHQGEVSDHNPDSAGRVLHEFEFEPQRKVHIDPANRAAILEGLHQAAQVPGGTSYGIFGGFPIDVAGKTGTAERVGYGDQSWYAVLAPYPNPRIVTIVTMEEGGFGAEAAAPAALEILEAYFHKQATDIEAENGGSPG